MTCTISTSSIQTKDSTKNEANQTSKNLRRIRPAPITTTTTHIKRPSKIFISVGAVCRALAVTNCKGCHWPGCQFLLILTEPENVPLDWLNTLDNIQSQNTSLLKMDDVISIAWEERVRRVCSHFLTRGISCFG